MSQVDNDSQRKTVALAGLLHDIGKFMQRAAVELDRQSEKMEELLCPYHKEGNYFSHRHALWTDHFFRKIIDGALLEDILGKFTYPDNVAALATYHHKPDSPWQSLIKQADRLSAKEREEGDTPKARGQHIKRRLSSIFEKIALEQTPSPKSLLTYAYSLLPLSLKEEVFPRELEGDQDLTDEYKDLWEGFEKQLSRVQKEVSQTKNKFDLLFNSLYSLLHKYTWSIPSFTQSECDISLFDHLRTTSALALCLYIVQNSSEEVKRPFLLVEGDISGIQKFICRLTAPTGVSHIARILRGRSFYLTLLPLVLAKYIISRLDLTVANILWCGGGKFDLLLPNTSETKTQLEEIKGEFTDWFFDEFEAELGIVFGKVEANEKEWRDFAILLDRLRSEVEEAKNQKFLAKVVSGARLNTGFPHEICRVCGLYEVEKGKEENICSKCSLQRDIGSQLPKASYLIFTRSGKSGNLPGHPITFGKFGTVYLLPSEHVLRSFYTLKDVTDILSINRLEDFPFGFTLIGKEVATASRDFTSEDGTLVEKGHILPFEILAQMSEGDKKLGVLKVDIDHLGLIFALGLPQEDRTISRIATLSRMLDWFLCGYVNTIAEEVSENWRAKNLPLKDNVQGCIYTIYSGGDDLLIVAPWSEAIGFADKLHSHFKEFTCSNPDLDLSAGLYLCKPKFTVGRASLLATEALNQAKDRGRKRIKALGDVVAWNKHDGIPGFHELLKLSEFLSKHLGPKQAKQDKLPHRFLHSLLQLRRFYASEGGINLNYIPLLLYIITRNVSGEHLKLKLMHDFISGDSAPGYFQNCLIPVSIALLKTRKGG